jgi:hypothetical protein
MFLSFLNFLWNFYYVSSVNPAYFDESLFLIKMADSLLSYYIYATEFESSSGAGIAGSNNAYRSGLECQVRLGNVITDSDLVALL